MGLRVGGWRPHATLRVEALGGQVALGPGQGAKSRRAGKRGRGSRAGTRRGTEGRRVIELLVKKKAKRISLVLRLWHGNGRRKDRLHVLEGGREGGGGNEGRHRASSAAVPVGCSAVGWRGWTESSARQPPAC